MRAIQFLTLLRSPRRCTSLGRTLLLATSDPQRSRVATVTLFDTGQKEDSPSPDAERGGGRWPHGADHKRCIGTLPDFHAASPALQSAMRRAEAWVAKRVVSHATVREPP